MYGFNVMSSAPRARSLSSDGRELFNLSTARHGSIPLKSRVKSAVNYLFHSMFTCVDDHTVNELLSSCRDSSCSFIHFIDHADISEFTDRFIYNIILLILRGKKKEKDGKHCLLASGVHEVKKNYGVYCSLAKAAHATGDHNTAWLVYQALNHHLLSGTNKTLKFKKSKASLETMKLLKEVYGDINTCYSPHVKSCLSDDGDDENFIPCSPILSMYAKRNRVYYDIWRKMKGNKISKDGVTYVDLTELEDLITLYRLMYSDWDKKLMRMYTHWELKVDDKEGLGLEYACSQLYDEAAKIPKKSEKRGVFRRKTI